MKPILLSLGAVLLASAAQADENKIRLAFPNTSISSIDCEIAAPLCEVVAGRSVFYTTPDAELMVIGRVFNLRLGKSLTDDRLDDLDAAFGGNETASLVANRRPEAVGGQFGEHFKTEDAIVTGQGAYRVAVLADPACPYCARLQDALIEAGDIEAQIYLTGAIGGRAVPEAVYCAKDPVQALYQAYTGQFQDRRTCQKSAAVGRNERAARSLGLSGTPVLIRSDGAVRFGALTASELTDWIKGAGQ